MYEDGECIDCGNTLHIEQYTMEYEDERIWLPRTYESALRRRIPEDETFQKKNCWRRYLTNTEKLLYPLIAAMKHGFMTINSAYSKR